jgi:hypothetical protein
MQGTSGTITLEHVLKQMDAGLPFNLIYVSADRRRGTGGQLIDCKGFMKNTKDQPEEKQPKGRIHAAVKKNPNHFLHKTRNIRNPQNGVTRKLHIKLIKVFNGKEVIL